MSKKQHNMKIKADFDNHSNQLNPTHEEYKKVHSESKGNSANVSKSNKNTSNSKK